REKLTARPNRAPVTPPRAATAQPLTVSQLTGLIDRAIKSGLPDSVLVKGEVSNCKGQHASGRLYFTLKDKTSCIDCVMWRSDATLLKFECMDGMELLAGGRVSVYCERGKYQLYVTSLQPLGQGALEVAFQQLRKKLEAEELFADSRKRPIPSYPLRIAIVTAAKG